MELLIRTEHKVPVVAPRFTESSQRGDVIAACADGWGWSEAERSNPDWIIINCPLTDVEAQALLAAARIGEPAYRRRLGVNPSGLFSGASLTRAELMARVF